jgi:hypothetical protein
MSAHAIKNSVERNYRRILGVRFFVGDASEAVDLGMRPGLVVVPAAPALMELVRDQEYRKALLETDLAITDSGFMVLLWNLMKGDRIQRVSGLEYLKILLLRSELREKGAVVWVMPSSDSLEKNVAWLRSLGLPTRSGFGGYDQPAKASSCDRRAWWWCAGKTGALLEKPLRSAPLDSLHWSGAGLSDWRPGQDTYLG